MSSGTDAIEALFAESPGGRAPRRRRRGWAIAGWIVGGLVVLLGIAAVLVDGAVRSAGESLAASQIEQRMPEGVDGAVTAHIGGASVLWQLITGSFEHVELDAPKLVVQGVPVAAHVVASGVPTSLDKPVAAVDGTVRLSAQALSGLVSVPGATGGLSLGEGTVGFDVSRTVLGLPLGVHVTAAPKADGTRILFTPKDAKVTAGPAGLDLSGVVAAILGEQPVPVCVADRLPRGVEVTDVAVTPQAATLSFAAKDVVLSAQTLQQKGSCSPPAG